MMPQQTGYLNPQFTAQPGNFGMYGQQQQFQNQGFNNQVSVLPPVNPFSLREPKTHSQLSGHLLLSPL